MSHTPARLAGLAAMLAALVLAPPAIAGRVPGLALKAKTKQHATRCASKAKRGHGASACKKAKKKLATTPSSACTGVSRKRVKGKRTSSYVRCVTAARKKAGQEPIVDKQADDAPGVDSLDPGESETDHPDDDMPLADGPLDGSSDDLADATDGTPDAPEIP
jgi:hypothetical protein